MTPYNIGAHVNADASVFDWVIGTKTTVIDVSWAIVRK
jgi:hypothetical protein